MHSLGINGEGETQVNLEIWPLKQCVCVYEPANPGFPRNWPLMSVLQRSSFSGAWNQFWMDAFLTCQLVT